MSFIRNSSRKKQLSDRNTNAVKQSNDFLNKVMADFGKSIKKPPVVWAKYDGTPNYIKPEYATSYRQKNNRQNLVSTIKKEQNYTVHSKVADIINTKNYRPKLKSDFDKAQNEERAKVLALKSEEKRIQWDLDRNAKKQLLEEEKLAEEKELQWRRKQRILNDKYNQSKQEEIKKDDVSIRLTYKNDASRLSEKSDIIFSNFGASEVIEEKERQNKSMKKFKWQMSNLQKKQEQLENSVNYLNSQPEKRDSFKASVSSRQLTSMTPKSSSKKQVLEHRLDTEEVTDAVFELGSDTV